MEQARNWGRLRQRLSFLEHAPPEPTSPSVLFVRAPEPDATTDLLVQALFAQDVRCTPGTPDIPLAWLWQHRAYHGKPIGILHFYRPGALHLSYRQRQRLWFRLWLAQQWGIRLVTTDGGGWWQSFRGLRFLTRRLLERKLFYCSQAIMSYTRQPNQLYPDKRLRRQVRCLPHPGFRGSYPPPLTRYIARAQLGILPTTDFVYLCLAPLHTERELVYLLTSFRELTSGKLRTQTARTREDFATHMVLIGAPCDKQVTGRVLKLAAGNPAISLHLTTVRVLRQDDFPLYIGAADALVLPHFALRTAGLLETAMLALSYERVVVAPDLPRFRGMLPPRASVLYEAGSRDALARALLSAQNLTSHHSEHEAMRLDAQTSWEQYAHRLVKIYRELLSN
jgi:glycosyltransferase involved in cell wall biosynthesis